MFNQMSKNNFSKIKSSKEKTYEFAFINRNKNAFSNINPPDHSRVKLKEKYAGDYVIQGSDYINANWLLNKKYIATQDPNLVDTIDDFYRMIYENDVQMIINLRKSCNYIFDNKLKFDDFTVSSSIRIDISNSITLRELLVGDNIVYHIHFKEWPDFGVPNYDDFLELIDIVNTYSKKDKPILVHCRAGIGRTGTFITIYDNLEKIKNNENIDIDGTIIKLRDDRDHMVQTYGQYMFCYETLLKKMLDINKNKTKINLRCSSEEILDKIIKKINVLNLSK